MATGRARTLAVRFGEAGRALVRTPAGWRLIAAPQGVTVVACPARPRPQTAAQEIVTATPDPTRVLAAARPRNVDGPTLPNTGQDIGAMVVLGATLVLAGALLLIVRRRPREVPAARPEPAALIWVETRGRVETRKR
jgi:LPXTG-motif cell wall-anchored protein